jgi:hypothetical protein
MNFGLHKDFYITEKFKTEFRMEAFNFFNKSNLGNPNGNRSAGGFGTITRPERLRAKSSSRSAWRSNLRRGRAPFPRAPRGILRFRGCDRITWRLPIRMKRFFSVTLSLASSGPRLAPRPGRRHLRLLRAKPATPARQGKYKFRVLFSSSHLPAEAQKVLKAAHGGFADRQPARAKAISTSLCPAPALSRSART